MKIEVFLSVSEVVGLHRTFSLHFKACLKCKIAGRVRNRSIEGCLDRSQSVP